MSTTGVGLVVWWSDADDEDYGAIVTPATEPWEIRCESHAIRDEGFLREGTRVRVEYVRADDGAYRWRATDVRRLPYDPTLLEPVHRDSPLPREAVVRIADNAWLYHAHDEALFVEYVVEQIQEEMHDLFIDTEWPACPRHPHHPMWYSDGYWRCATDEVPIVPLGELVRLRSS